MSKIYYVYILASKRNGTLYIGVTSDLIKRVYQHKNDQVKGFTSNYQVHMLVYYEETNSIEEAIIREKQIKDINRNDKLAMIKKFNPAFKDLYNRILDAADALPE